MAQKTITLRHGGGLRFVAATGSGHQIAMDNATGNSGPRPTEVLLAALGACTAMDVVSILAKKRQEFETYAVRVEGTQRETVPDIFTRIDVIHEVTGDVDPVALARSIELSALKYCTVSAQLSTGSVEIRHRYVLRRSGRESDAEAQSAEVCVTGPLRLDIEP